MGLPMFDRLGAGHLLSVGYRGGRDLIFNISNLLILDHEQNHEPTPLTWSDGAHDPGAGAKTPSPSTH
jgi:nitrogenase molybdenum-iron protein NifN